MSPSAHRLIPALGVVLAVALLGFGAVGVATAQGDDARLPKTFTLAARHAGDQATYEGWSSYAVPAGTYESRWNESVTWGLEQPFLMDDGTWRAVHERRTSSDRTLDVTVQGSELSVAEFSSSFVETATGAVIGHKGLAGISGSAGWSLGALSESHTASSILVQTDWHVDECALETRLVAGVSLAAPVDLPASCGILDGPLSYTASAVRVDGLQAIRFEALQSGTDGSTFRSLYEFAAGVPEPLREEWSRSGPGDESAVGRRLVGFEAGSGAWATGIALPPARPLPPIVLAPHEPWGPSDLGVQHPFPASQAWAAARDDLTFTKFRDYLAAHPAARAVSGDYEELHDGNRTSRIWSFDIIEPGQEEQRFWLTATRTSGPAGAVGTDLLGLPVSAPVERDEHEFSGFEVHSEGFPDGEWPDQVPTVASVMQRWQALTGSPEPANSWSFSSDGVEAGSALIRFPPTSVLAQVQGETRTATATFLHLRADLDGSIAALVEEQRVESQSRAGLQDDVPAGIQPGDRLQGSRPTMVLSSIGWAAPSTPAASGAAAISLLAGLLYWLWPALKGAPIGLFSRIEAPRLLEHPVRRGLVDAVEANPGIHYQALLRLVGGGKGATEHHLRKLVDAGLLVRHQGPGYTCFFPPRTDHRVAAAVGLLKSGGARRVLAAVQQHPGVSSVQLAAMTGLDASTVSHHVARLAGAGLLEASKVGRTLSIRPTGIAGAALDAAAGAAA